MKIVTQFPRAVREIETLNIPMADGCRLAARVWMPEDSESDPVPALLEFLPYRRRDGTVVRDELTHPYLAGHGYACVRVDMRGNGDSDGLMEDEYTAQELADAKAVIEWLAGQPWCSGTVGMMGISWGGFNALQVAALKPAPLKAIVTICSTDDRYADDVHYVGGCLLNDNFGWSAQMLGYSSRPPDPAVVGERWREMWLERLEAMPLLAANWLQHQRRDAYWRHGSVCEDFGTIDAAVLAVGGWADAYSNAVPRLLAGLKAPRKGIIGPWVHRYPHIAWPEPAIGFLQEMLRWWDRWLKGVDTGVESDPDLRVFIQDMQTPAADHARIPGRWVAEATWPSLGIERHSLFLTEEGLRPEPGRRGKALIASPQHVGLAGGGFCPGIRAGLELPTDQREDDGLSVVFDTPPLDHRLELLGAPVLDLELSSDMPQALLAARLCAVAPDGTSARLSFGLLNLTHRDSHADPTALQPGQAYRVRLQLNDLGQAIPEGYRLRIALSTSYWPLVWPSPEEVSLTLDLKEARLTLPVRPQRSEDPVTFPEPECSPPLRADELRQPENLRRIERDLASEEVTLIVEDDGGLKRLLDHGLETGSWMRQSYTIRPNDLRMAQVEAAWTMETARGDWRTRAESSGLMWADETHFHLEARLVAFEGDEQIFEKSWRERIPRDFV